MKNIKKTALDMAEILQKKGAEDIQIIDISDVSVIADYFVICSGRSNVQVKALCDELENKLSEQGIDFSRKEGYSAGRWIVLDYKDILVHLFHTEEREFYNIERLWTTGDNLQYYPPRDAQA